MIMDLSHDNSTNNKAECQSPEISWCRNSRKVDLFVDRVVTRLLQSISAKPSKGCLNAFSLIKDTSFKEELKAIVTDCMHVLYKEEFSCADIEDSGISTAEYTEPDESVEVLQKNELFSQNKSQDRSSVTNIKNDTTSNSDPGQKISEKKIKSRETLEKTHEVPDIVDENECDRVCERMKIRCRNYSIANPNVNDKIKASKNMEETLEFLSNVDLNESQMESATIQIMNEKPSHIISQHTDKQSKEDSTDVEVVDFSDAHQNESQMKRLEFKIKCETGGTNWTTLKEEEITTYENMEEMSATRDAIAESECRLESSFMGNESEIGNCTSSQRISKEEKKIYRNSEDISVYTDIAYQSGSQVKRLLSEVKVQDGHCSQSEMNDQDCSCLVKGIEFSNTHNSEKNFILNTQTESNGVTVQEIKMLEKEECKEIDVVPFIADRIGCCNESLYMKVTVENSVIDLENVLINKAMSGSHNKNTDVVSRCNVSENKSLVFTRNKTVTGDYNLKKVPVIILERCDVTEKKLMTYNHYKSGIILTGMCCKKCHKICDLSDHKCTADYQFQCTVCSKRLKSKRTLKAHMILHSNTKDYKCEECGKICVSRRKLLYHLQVHSIEMRYQCSICNKIFKLKKLLKYHMNVLHGGDSTYVCRYCGKVCAHKSGLLSHLLVHSGEKIHNCTVCGKSFKTKSVLTKHLQTHNNEKRYKCEVCEKCFTQASSLQMHLLLHYGGKRYKCYICDKAFTQKGNLQAHLLIHSDLKECFKCKLCEKSFPRKSGLSEHVKAHLVGSVYKCDICGKTLKMKKYLKRHIVRHKLSSKKRETKRKNTGTECTKGKKKTFVYDAELERKTSDLGRRLDQKSWLQKIVKSEAADNDLYKDYKSHGEKVEKSSQILQHINIYIKKEPQELNNDIVIVKENTVMENKCKKEKESLEVNDNEITGMEDEGAHEVGNSLF